MGRVIALMFCIGALPFVNNARVHAQDKVGLTYGAKATLNANYLWRGLYAGGMNTQLDVNVGYGGLYLDMWWNIGAADWSFKAFQPEVDFTLGFARWGLDVNLLYIYNFNCGFFDFHNYPDKGNRLELNVSYTVSDKIPLTIHWATRVAASDGYTETRMTEDGRQVTDTLRAWSSYAEICYNWKLRNGFSIYTALGITPWGGCYTGYERRFALQNIDVRLRKDWDIHPRCGLMLMGQINVCPSAPIHVINTNLAFGVYLK